MANPHNKITQQKVLACYPHVYTSSIYKLIGCKKPQPYEILERLGLPIVGRVPKKSMMPSKWVNI